MSSAARSAWLGLVSIAGLLSCGSSAFLCDGDAECTSAQGAGRCEPTRYCSFVDEGCESGYRYGSDAGEGLAGQCVEPVEPATGGIADDDDDDPTGSDGSEGDADGETGVATPCGNGALDPGEDCDPGMPAQPCVAAGIPDGMLACTDACEWDTSDCSECGNGSIEGAEVCDGSNLAGATCQTEGYVGGTVSCNEDCLGFDVSACETCGNGVVDPGELCDGADLGGQDCLAFGYGRPDPLACNDACNGFDTSRCSGVLCGFDPDPVGACAPECDDCRDGRCVIDCIGADACAGQEIVCPAGSSCLVLCNGGNACENATVMCPPTHFGCEVDCIGSGTCRNADVICGSVGSCHLSCAGDSCAEVLLDCGSDECSASCDFPTDVQVACGDEGCLCTDDC